MVEEYKSKQEGNLPAQSKPVNLLFLGEIGSGKTTLLTALKDHFEGKSFEERSIIKDKS